MSNGKPIEKNDGGPAFPHPWVKHTERKCATA